MKINNFIKLLKINYKSFFVNKKSSRGYIKTIEEFRDDLINIQFFENTLSEQQLLDTLKEKNNEFFTIARFETDMKHNPGNFYQNELKHIEKKIIFSLKKTNFIQWLHNDKKEVPYHINKKGKKRISKKLKDECWIQEFGNLLCAPCPIKSCSILLHKNN